MSSHHYPFGSPIPGRKFQSSSSYRYGFNGKENDKETVGTGSGTQDYGARIYNPSLGRWLSLDPLMEKYPFLSPYSYAANNPILFVDRDGRDYGIYINHTDHTIIIKATLYSTEVDSKAAQISANHWNEQSGKFQYKVGVGDQAVYYDIKIEITVDVNKLNSERDKKFRADKSGESNRFDETIKPMANAGEAGSNDGGINDILVVKGLTEKRKTGAHEVGHILGLGHFLSGIMARGKHRSDVETEVTTGNVSKILSRAGIGNVCETSCDTELTKPKGTAASTEHTTGTAPAPANFKTGDVEKKTSE